MKLILTIALAALTLAASALAESVSEKVKIYRFQPVGNGDPNAISRYRAEVTGTHTTKIVCHRNLEWVRINAQVKAPPADNAGPQCPSFPRPPLTRTPLSSSCSSAGP